MHLRIIYPDNRYDYVTQKTFEKLLTLGKISKFFRRSEKRWVTVGVDKMRGDGGSPYTGKCRRTPIQ